MADKCVGRPIGWAGGQVKFCNEPVTMSGRFCYRCHIVAIAVAVERLASLQLQVARAQMDLSSLMSESKGVPQ